MLADSEHVQTDLIGVLDLFNQVPQTLRRTDRKAGVVVRGCEAIDSDLHPTPR
jgi:hypothetical protein